MACYVGGQNPSYAYKYPSNSLNLFATAKSACTAATSASTCNGNCADNYAYMTSVCDTLDSNGIVVGGIPVTITSASAAYGACTSTSLNTASVCNNGAITADYRDPNCSDNTTFTADGINILSTTTIDLTSNVTQSVTTDSTSGNTTTIDTTVDTTTTTNTGTASNQVVDTSSTVDNTTTTTTTITDSSGVVIGTNTVVSSDSSSTPQKKGFASVSLNCTQQPTCSGDNIQCAILLQTWQSACLNYDATTQPGHTVLLTSFSDTSNTFSSRISNSPIVLAFSNIKNLIPVSAGVCPLFTIDLPAPISQTVSTDLQCTLFASVKPALSAVMLVVYTFFGFRIIASA